MLLMWSTPKVAPVIVVILVLFPTMYAQLDAAITGIDSGLIEMANIYKVSKKDKISKIYLPQIAPNTFSQAGANFSLGIKVMISAEVLSYTYRSIGGMMQQSKLYAEMPRFAALVIICIVVGLIVEVALSKLTLLTNKWNRKGVAYEN
jgi:NitT/TauT family transport system permease protein